MHGRLTRICMVSIMLVPTTTIVRFNLHVTATVIDLDYVAM